MSKAIKIIIGILVVSVLIGVTLIYGCVSNKKAEEEKRKAEEEKRKTVSTYEELVEADGYVTLDSDIDLNYQTIEPINCETFDGQGHTIKNFIISANGATNKASFFSESAVSIKNVNFEGASIKGENVLSLAVVKIGGGGTIENINVKDCLISASQNSYLPCYVGGIYAGAYKASIESGYLGAKTGKFSVAYGVKISNCTVENLNIEINGYKNIGAISAKLYAGAIAGAGNNITDCKSYNCNITVESCDPYVDPYVGGVIGYCEGKITNTSALNNEISVRATYYEDSIFSYFSAADVCVGGLTGYCKSNEVLYCESKDNTITGNCAGAFNAGGLVGYAYESNISQSYARGNKIECGGFKEKNKQNYLRAYGGLVGYAASSTISSSYAANNTLKEKSQIVGSDMGDAKASGLCVAGSKSSINYCGTYNNILNANGVDELCTTKLDGLYSCIITSTKYGNTNNCEVVAEDFWLTADSLRNKLLLDGSWKFSAMELPYLELDIANN